MNSNLRSISFILGFGVFLQGVSVQSVNAQAQPPYGYPNPARVLQPQDPTPREGPPTEGNRSQWDRSQWDRTQQLAPLTEQEKKCLQEMLEQESLQQDEGNEQGNEQKSNNE